MKRSHHRYISIMLTLTMVLSLLSGVLPQGLLAAEPEAPGLQSPVFHENGEVTVTATSVTYDTYINGDFVGWNEFKPLIPTGEQVVLDDGAVHNVLTYTFTPQELTRMNGVVQYKLAPEAKWDHSYTDTLNHAPQQGDNSAIYALQISAGAGEEAALAAGASLQLKAERTLADGTKVDLTTAEGLVWASDSAAVTVDAGLLTAAADAPVGQKVSISAAYQGVTVKRSFDVAAQVMVAALMDASDTIDAVTSMPVTDADLASFRLIDKTNEGAAVTATAKKIGDRKVRLTIADPQSVDVRHVYEVSSDRFAGVEVIMRRVLDDAKYYYDGELGAIYSADHSTFKLWAPTAQKVTLRLYDDAGEDRTAGTPQEMTRADNGVWSAEVPGDLAGTYYMFQLDFANGMTTYALDPYARASSVNSTKSAVVDLSATNPDRWLPDSKPPFMDPVDAVIYELHTRDFSMDDSSGISETHRGKFMAFTETGTKLPGHSDISTGVDHLKELGITHVQLLPFYDYSLVDEAKVEDPAYEGRKFNWGYDPVNYNVPEGSYATNAAVEDPAKRIREMKAMIQALHDQGIRIVLDVVYNHTYVTGLQSDHSVFDKIVPGYYYRSDETGTQTNGSGVTNDIASERPMVRKMIRDSVIYLAKEYNVDGFRFDLMGLTDTPTAKKITRELKEQVDPSLILYGEPWMGGSTALPPALQTLKGSQRDTEFAVFNDNIRGAIKGDSDGAGKGFATGEPGREAAIVTGVKGSIDDFTNSPEETINYVTVHDNLNLWDKVMATQGLNAKENPFKDVDPARVMDNETVKRSLLANSIVMTSQGIALFNAGDELLRSKFGDHNSYKSSDEINKIRWEQKALYKPVFDYYQGLIELRRTHPAFRMSTKAAVEANLHVYRQEDGIVAFQLKEHANGDSWKTITVIYNGGTSEAEVALPHTAEWKVVVDGQHAGVTPIRTVTGDKVKVEALSMMVLYDEERQEAPVATSVDLGMESIGLNPGTSRIFRAVVKDQYERPTADQSVVWTSSDDKVVTVDASGRVQAVNTGTAELTASAASGAVKAKFTVHVAELVPGSIKVSGPDSVFAGRTIQLSAQVVDQFGQELPEAALEWSSADAEVAVVDREGRVTGQKPGKAKITVKAGSQQAELTVTVKPYVKRYISFNYVRPDGDYKDWNLWVWNTGVKNDQIDFERIENGVASVSIEIAPETKSIGYVLRKGTDWSTAKQDIPGDRSIQVKEDDTITKVYVTSMVQEIRQLPSVHGPEWQGGAVSFHYRNDELFAAGKMDSITGVSVDVLGDLHEMTYDPAAERFSYTMENVPNGEHEYTFHVTREGQTTEIPDPGNTVDGKSIVKKQVGKRYISFNYVRPDGDYKDWNLWVWNTGVKNDQIDFERVENGIAKVNIEIAPETRSIGFIVRKGTDWNTAKQDIPDGRTILVDEESITKVYVTSMVPAVRQLPAVKGPETDDGAITFHYRDNDLFAAGEMDQIEQVSVEVLGSLHEMAYDAAAERFSATLKDVPEGDHEYAFHVTRDGRTVEIPDPQNTVEGKSIVSLHKIAVTVSGSVTPSALTSREQVILSVNAQAEEAGHKFRELYVDLTELGGPKKTVIDQELGQLSIGVTDATTAGDKILKVTAVDRYGYRTTADVPVTVKARTDAGGGADDFDWDEARIYFMLTDRFMDGDTSNNLNVDKSHPEAYHGGDFRGIIQKLDYLDQLGINTIWISPIVDNIDFNKGVDFNDTQYGYHGYWAKDFTKIDEHLGDLETFKELIDGAHDRGMKIMVDVVLNHTGYGLKPGDTYEGVTQEDKDRFAGMLRTDGGSDEILGELSGLPDLRTEDPAVRAQIIAWQTDWLKKAKTERGNTIDYFRVDTIKHVEGTTWKAFRNALTAMDPEFRLIGENFGATDQQTGGFLRSGQMDSLLDFGFKDKAADFVNEGRVNAVEQYLEERDALIDNTSTLGQFLSSHDENGFLHSRINGDFGKLKVAAALQITSKGQPVIYYGEELGLSGRNGGDFSKGEYSENRKDMPWNLLGKQEEQELHDHYQKLLGIRAKYSKTFSKGSRTKLAGSDENGYLVFDKAYGKEHVVVGLNTKEDPVTASFKVPFAAGAALVNEYSGSRYTVGADQTVSVSIPGRKAGGTIVLALAPPAGGSYSGGSYSAPASGSTAGVRTVDAAALKPVQDGPVRIELNAEQYEVQLPAEAGTLLGASPLQLKFPGVTLELPASLLQELQALLPAAEQRGAKLTLKSSPAAAEAAQQLLDRAEQQESGLQLQASGTVYDLRLQAVDSRGTAYTLPNFRQGVKLSFPAGAEGVQSELLGVYHLADNGSLDYVGGLREQDTVTAKVYHFSVYGLLEYTKSYADVSSTHWAAPVIRSLSARHVVDGMSETAFAPEAEVTRAQFTAMLVRALGLQPAAEPAPFQDIPADAWYAGAVGAAYSSGLVGGRSEGEFAPDSLMTREEMAVLLVRASGLRGAAQQPAAADNTAVFEDAAEISSWAREAVLSAAADGLLEGRDAQRFAPQGWTTRAECAQVLYRLMQP